MNEDIPFYTTEGIKDIHEDFIFRDLITYWRLSQGSHEKRDLSRILNHPSRYLKNDFFKNCDFSMKEMQKVISNNIPSGFKRTKALENINSLFHDVSALRDKSPVDFMKYIGNYVGPYGYLKWLTGDYADWCKKNPDEYLSVWDSLMEEAKTMHTMEEWCQYAKTYAEMLEIKKRSKKQEGVCLTTMHSSKGLEWKVVFIVDVNEDITPSKHAKTAKEFEEERRAFYVAVTRAKQCLHLSYTDGNDRKDFAPSRYISELELGSIPSFHKPQKRINNIFEK